MGLSRGGKPPPLVLCENTVVEYVVSKERLAESPSPIASHRVASTLENGQIGFIRRRKTPMDTTPTQTDGVSK